MKTRVAILAIGVLGQRFQTGESSPFETAALVEVMVGKPYEDAAKRRLGSRILNEVSDCYVID